MADKIIELKVVTMKGQTCSVKVSSDDTVSQLKVIITNKMSGQQLKDVKLIWRAKPLNDDTKTLAQVGVKPGKNNQMHLVSRVFGGERTPVQEVAYQLRFALKAKLFGVKLIEAEDEFTWNIWMHGPRTSPYEKGQYSITFKFPLSYPYSAPLVSFNTPIYHPNVYADGRLCWHEDDTTGSKYFADILIGAINSLLITPNPDSPANPEAANFYIKDRAEYIKRAREHTELHASYSLV